MPESMEVCGSSRPCASRWRMMAGGIWVSDQVVDLDSGLEPEVGLHLDLDPDPDLDLDLELNPVIANWSQSVPFC